MRQERVRARAYACMCVRACVVCVWTQFSMHQGSLSARSEDRGLRTVMTQSSFQLMKIKRERSGSEAKTNALTCEVKRI